MDKSAGGISNGYSIWFVSITVFFLTALLTANIISVKLVSFGAIILPAGIIVFPISYIAGDVLTEIYGYGHARRVIWLGFLCNIIMVAAIWAGGLLPPAQFWDGQAAYERILFFTPRLLVASFFAYLAGELANAYVMARMKLATGGRWLWTRTVGSTLVGQGIDSFIFITIAFAGTIPTVGLLITAVTQWLVKCLYEIAATPLTYLAVYFLKRREGIEDSSRLMKQGNIEAGGRL
ncbi:MAG: VUT family protein [Desulfobacteraceae bacterium]|jgi:uncharacterized integral membrane protein (TIGR00697 family)|nr:MAG: VUT family protein [Desulfobacteraceae bacterium]